MFTKNIMLSTISNINLMRKPINVVSTPDANATWMIAGSPVNANVNVSTDYGTTWNSYNLSVTLVKGIAYGLTSNNTPLWVAAVTFAGGGGVKTSTDSGKTWSSGTVLTNQTCDCVAYGKNSSGDNLFMVGGYRINGTDNIIFSSSNGTTWIGIMDNTILNLVSGIKYGKLGDGTNVWIAVGIYASGGAGLAYSTNGSSWTQVDPRPSIPNTEVISSITYGIDDAGNKRWVLAANKSPTSSPCIYTLINPTTTSLNTWTAVTTTLMTGKCFSVTFGRSSSGNVFVAAGGVGSGTGYAIVSFNGTTSTGYISLSTNTPYQGSSVGYLNTGDATTSRFYATQFGKANKMLTSQYGSSWSEIDFNYNTTPNTVSGAIVSSIPY